MSSLENRRKVHGFPVMVRSAAGFFERGRTRECLTGKHASGAWDLLFRPQTHRRSGDQRIRVDLLAEIDQLGCQSLVRPRDMGAAAVVLPLPCRSMTARRRFVHALPSDHAVTPPTTARGLMVVRRGRVDGFSTGGPQCISEDASRRACMRVHSCRARYCAKLRNKSGRRCDWREAAGVPGASVVRRNPI